MSSIFSAALDASALASNELGCERPHSARSTISVVASSQNTGLILPATKTSDRSASDADRSISFAADFPVSHSAQRLAEDGLQSTYGPKCFASCKQPHHDTSLPKTSRKRRSPTRLETSLDLALQRTTVVFQGLTSGQTIKEIVGGLLHTPTRKANFVAPSMMKWPSCRRFVQAFGGREITPEQFEFLMGLPIGWTELEPSETRSSRKSRKRSAARS